MTTIAIRSEIIHQRLHKDVYAHEPVCVDVFSHYATVLQVRCEAQVMYEVEGMHSGVNPADDDRLDGCMEAGACQ